jgi:hypothetical protein
MPVGFYIKKQQHFDWSLYRPVIGCPVKGKGCLENLQARHDKIIFDIILRK